LRISERLEPGATARLLNLLVAESDDEDPNATRPEPVLGLIKSAPGQCEPGFDDGRDREVGGGPRGVRMPAKLLPAIRTAPIPGAPMHRCAAGSGAAPHEDVAKVNECHASTAMSTLVVTHQGRVRGVSDHAIPPIVHGDSTEDGNRLYTAMTNGTGELRDAASPGGSPPA